MRAFLKNPIWLAPMAGVSDKAFRTICLEHGAGLTYSEMVSAKGLLYGGAKTLALAGPAPAESRIAVQLFGADPQVIADQAARLERRLGERLAAIDLNMGCPVPKVVKRGEGAALMKRPDLSVEIVARTVGAVRVPVTAKFRSGWDGDEPTAPVFAQLLEQAGATLVAVHGRSARQLYSGTANWDVIAQVKRAVRIPVAGSGDVFSHADAERMMRECGVDVVLAARGARGNPWIFSGKLPSLEERIETAREHLGLYARFNGEEHLTPLRAQLAWYVQGLPGARVLRRALGRASTRGDFEGVLADALRTPGNGEEVER